MEEINKLLVLSYYNPWVSGGGHRPICVLEEEVKKERKVLFIYLSDSESDNMNNFKLYRNKNLLLFRYESKTEMIIPINESAKKIIIEPINIYIFINEWKPQFIRSHNPVYEYIPILEFAKKMGLPHIYDQMDYWEGFPVKPWGENTEKRYIDLATECITISNWLKRNTIANKVLHVIPNGIKQSFLDELEYVDLSTIIEKSLKRKRVVLYVGAIWPAWFDWKLVEYIVRQRPNYKFVFIGSYKASKEENDGRNVEQLVDKLGKNENVSFLGQIPHHKLIPWLKEADVGIIPFVRSSLIEACSPLKCYEYLAAYLPVVSTHLPEIDGFPSVSTVKDKESFLKKLDYYLLNARTTQELLKMREFIENNTWERRLEEFDYVEKKAMRLIGEELCW